MNQRYNMCDAHARALHGIQEDAEIGRLPFYDYSIDYLAYFGEQPPEPSLELVGYLENCQKIGESSKAKSAMESIYKRHALQIPIGFMDLPVWWTKSIIAAIAEVNWVEPDPERTQAVFGWTMVHLQGPYLDIQYPRPLPIDPEEWLQIGSQILKLHRGFEPGPFSQPNRLIEFT